MRLKIHVATVVRWRETEHGRIGNVGRWLRTELASRTYAPGLGLGRFPTPVYANEQNCAGCHIGGRPGAFGQVLEQPYEGNDVVTPIPAAPGFLPGDVSTACSE